jgi:hypothetical protein
VQTCLRSARCSSKDAEIVSARARQRENNEVAPHRPRTALVKKGMAFLPCAPPTSIFMQEYPEGVRNQGFGV